MEAVQQKQKPLKTIYLTEDEYLEHTDAYDGVCLGCGKWTSGGVEPDAEKYRCEDCGEAKVYGTEQAMVIGRLYIDEDEGDT